MTGPIDSVYPDGSPVTKSAVRGDDKTAKRRNISDVSTVQNTDLSGQIAGIYVRAIQANFDLDTFDATSLHNGTTVLVDAAGNRFKIIPISADAIAASTHAAMSKSVPVDADEIPLVDTAASNVLKKLSWANLKAALASTFLTTGAVRERLAANRTYYVRTDGSDSNDGRSNASGGAFLTIQKAIDVVAALDISTFNVTISVADGTYTGATLASGPWVGSGSVTVVGNTTTPANVVINPAAGGCFTVTGGGFLIVSGMELRGQFGFVSQRGSRVYGTTSLRFGTSTNYQVWANGGQVILFNNYSIVGGAQVHLLADSGGQISATGLTVTFTGTPAFSVCYANAGGVGSSILGYSCTFSGSATGTRFSVQQGALINSNGGGANYFPGNAAGAGTNFGASPWGLYQ